MAEISENNAPTSGVTVGVVKESVPGETRVGLIPDSVKHLVGKGLSVVVQAGAGEGSSIADSEYEEAGARIVATTADIHAAADVVVRVQAPAPDRGELDGLKQDQILVSFLAPLSNHELNSQLAESGVTAMAVDAVPRITRAQSMDALSAMSTISGYKAALLAAEKLPKFFPLLMTAAGTIRPAKVLVLGAGVAGLQAIATARRLGAVVEAYDVRAVVKEQVESLGAKFVEIDTGASNAEAAGGYAREATPEELKKQQEGLNDHIANSDVVITTALVPGRPAPKMIPGSAVERMRTGSVIVDLAAETGGNCELTTPGEVTTEHGVTIIGTLNLPATLPVHGSQMYGKVITNFLDLLIKDGQVNLNFDDAIIANMAITNRGEIVQEQTRKLMGLGELAPANEVESVGIANGANEEGGDQDTQVGASDSYDSTGDDSADVEGGEDSAGIVELGEEPTTYRPFSGNNDGEDSPAIVDESEADTSDSEYIPFADQTEQADGDVEDVPPLDASTEIDSFSVEDGYETVADSETGNLYSDSTAADGGRDDDGFTSDTDSESASTDGSMDSTYAESSIGLDSESATDTNDSDGDEFTSDADSESASTDASMDSTYAESSFGLDGDSATNTDDSDGIGYTSDADSESASTDGSMDSTYAESSFGLDSESATDTDASDNAGFTSDTESEPFSADDGTDVSAAEYAFDINSESVAADDGSAGSDANISSESGSETSFGSDTSAESGSLSADDGSDVSLGEDSGSDTESGSESGFTTATSGFAANMSGNDRHGQSGSSSADSTVDADKLESFLHEEEFDSTSADELASTSSGRTGEGSESSIAQGSSSDDDSITSVAATRKSSKLPLVGEGEDWIAGDGSREVPAGFPIKGNANSGIYHPEESLSYGETVAEIYFANGDAAETHGYRLPKMLQKLVDKADSESGQVTASRSESGASTRDQSTLHDASADESGVNVEEESDKNE